MERDYASLAYVHSLSGIFRTYRSPTARCNRWLWFFMGLLFGPMVGIVLASKSADDLKKSKVV